MCNPPPPPPPGGVNGASYVPKLHESSGIDISNCIEGGSMKFTTLVDYIYVCAVTNAFPCNECNLLIFLFFLNHFFSIYLKPVDKTGDFAILSNQRFKNKTAVKLVIHYKFKTRN